jgi:hypothetical protein
VFAGRLICDLAGQRGADRARHRSKRLQELGEVALCPSPEPEPEGPIVVVDDLTQGAKSSVVVETTLGMRPQTLERRRPVSSLRRAVGLEAVDPDLLGRVQVPARLGLERRHVTTGATCLAVEQFLAARRRVGIEASFRGWRRRDRQLIEV